MEVADESDALIATLTSRGWCFRDLEEIKTTIMIQSAILGDTCTVDSLESEIANMDFRFIGGKSLPDPSVFRKSSYLVGPKVLQISSVRDVSRSSIEEFSKSSHSRRLFKLNLTDGHSEITAAEYAHIPSIPDDVVPGTKVCLQSKAAIRNGIVCLNPKVITVLGGVVQSLYEEWQIKKKYSTLSRSTLRSSQESDTDGPPPFEKFQIGRTSHNLAQQEYFGSISHSTGPTVDPSGNSKIRQLGNHPILDLKDHVDGLKKDSSSEMTEEHPSSSTSDMRPKEVAECIPIQNQAAAQKLLQKMAYPNRDDRHSRDRKQKGKGKQEELPTFTLAEWENRKSEAKPLNRANNSDIRRDEDLAWQLQNQFDLEDHVERGPHEADPKNIKMSMFNYERDGERVHGAEYNRGRGRGKGRGGGGRGRGHGQARGRRRFD